MNEKYYIFVIEKSSNKHVQFEVKANSLKELDIIIANSFRNYDELRSYIINKAKERGYNGHSTYKPYPRIKIVSKDRKNPVRYVSPIFELIDETSVLGLCKDALSKKEEFVYNSDEISIISRNISGKEITYENLRECTFPLKRLRYKNVTIKVNEPNEEYNIDKYIKKTQDKTKKRINNLHYL